jgi:hypothetical protein
MVARLGVGADAYGFGWPTGTELQAVRRASSKNVRELYLRRSMTIGELVKNWALLSIIFVVDHRFRGAGQTAVKAFI